ncbi:hypothetical protein C2E23DRAFT_95008 [Lenzites betulinus]|nr:hypothetical protein C2E23DRAFT_95008 [Lenzites betulinus]
MVVLCLCHAHLEHITRALPPPAWSRCTQLQATDDPKGSQDSKRNPIPAFDDRLFMAPDATREPSKSLLPFSPTLAPSPRSAGRAVHVRGVATTHSAARHPSQLRSGQSLEIACRPRPRCSAEADGDQAPAYRSAPPRPGTWLASPILASARCREPGDDGWRNSIPAKALRYLSSGGDTSASGIYPHVGICLDCLAVRTRWGCAARIWIARPREGSSGPFMLCVRRRRRLNLPHSAPGAPDTSSPGPTAEARPTGTLEMRPIPHAEL